MELFSLLRQVGAKAGSFALLLNVVIVGTGAVHCYPVAVTKMPFRSSVGSIVTDYPSCSSSGSSIVFR